MVQRTESRAERINPEPSENYSQGAGLDHYQGIGDIHWSGFQNCRDLVAAMCISFPCFFNCSVTVVVLSLYHNHIWGTDNRGRGQIIFLDRSSDWEVYTRGAMYITLTLIKTSFKWLNPDFKTIPQWKETLGVRSVRGGKCILHKRIPTTLRLSCYEEMQDTRKSECGKRVYQEVPTHAPATWNIPAHLPDKWVRSHLRSGSSSHSHPNWYHIHQKQTTQPSTPQICDPQNCKKK